MVEIADIKDLRSVSAWLKETDQTQEVCVWLAHRSALRSLDIYWAWVLSAPTSQKGDLTATPILRSVLISGVAAVLPTPEIRLAANSADSAYFANSAAYSADSAAYSAYSAAATVYSADSAYSAANSAAYSANSTSATAAQN